MKAAIYSRKSIFTGKGESIENQIELCKEYGNRLGITEYCIYEDEGYSGGNTNRPRFQQLLKDLKKKEFDILICYRLDRISRNVADFSSTLEFLQQNNIGFISIREQFDTSTPMGRAMVYIASVFAQLERETIAERVRDNMLQLAKTGRWLGGQVPYGFKADRITYLDEEFRERSLMHLIPIDEELTIVKLVYAKYLEFSSIAKAVKYLNSKNLKGKNGGRWAYMQIKRLLSNPLYVKSTEETSQYLIRLGMNVFGKANGNGYLTYNKTKNIIKDRAITEWISAIGAHAGIIEGSTWIHVQQLLNKNKTAQKPRLGTGENSALLAGILRCDICGSAMVIKQGHNSKTKPYIRYDYYVCSSKISTNSSLDITKCTNKNIRVDILDSIILNKLKIFDKTYFLHELSKGIDNNISNNLHQMQIQSINSRIVEKQNSIQNLINRLSNNISEDISKYILLEIEKFNKELKDLQAELSSLKNLRNNNSNDNLSFYYTNTTILDTIKSFEKDYSALSNIADKRNLLRTVINYITWNGASHHYKIYLIESNKKR